MLSRLTLLFLFSILVFCSCSHTHSKIAPPYSTKKVTVDTPNTDTIFKDKRVIVIGSKLDRGEDAVNYVAVKFKPYIRFSDFRATVEDTQKKAPIQFYSNPLAREYRTRIRETYSDQGTNFGGHYCLVDWGYGSNAGYCVLIDTNTGVVYNGVENSEGYDFRKNSRMLIVNPPDSTGFYLANVDYDEPLIYLWNEKRKRFEQR